ncbi:MAG: class I SAM-dependent methyltransferase family protein [Candidatus Thorarchaeota archaeon]
MRYREYLKSNLADSIPENLILPRGYDVVGHVALLTLPFDDPKLASRIGKLTLDYDSRIRSVAVRTGPTEGETRLPSFALVAGDLDTLTTHTENGVRFRVDPLRLTFSRGNRGERISLPKRVAAHEHVVDMFACVGQFGLHIAARTNAHVTAIEINPEAFRFLQENIMLNNVQDRMRAVLGDCREVHPVGIADRVVMGYLHDTIDFLPAALETLSPKGGWVHLHTAIPAAEANAYCNTISTIAQVHDFQARPTYREVKHYSPGIVHYVFDIELRPSQHNV